MKTMKASFSQTYTSKLGNEEKSEGTLALKKPGNMKWEYKSPEGKFIVTDGERLVLFDPRTKQAIVQLQDQKTKLPVAVSLLFGGVNLKSAFDVLDAKQDGKITSLVLKPKQTMPNVQKIELELETSKQVRIIGSKISDDLGGTNAMKFTNIQFETKLDKKTFSTAIPKGAAIVTGNPLP